MRAHLRLLLTLFLLFCSTLSFGEEQSKRYPRTTIDDVEKVVSRYKTIDQFLKDPKGVERYYEALVGYYGGGDPERFSRDGFDDILSQLETIIHDRPELKNVFWQKRKPGPVIMVKTELRTTGRLMDVEAYQKHNEDLIQKLYSDAGEAAKLGDGRRPEKIQELVIAQNEKTQAFEASLGGLSKAEQAKATASFYKELRADPAIRQMASYLASDLLRSMGKIVNDGDADMVLHQIGEFKQNPAKALAEQGYKNLPNALVAETKALLPSVDELLKDKDMFPVQMRTAHDGKTQFAVGGGAPKTYEFKDSPRVLHSSFKGAAAIVQECIGGGSAGSPTPTRWATGILQGSDSQLIETNGSFLGFNQIIPIENKKTKKIYVSVDFVGPVMSRKIWVRDPNTGELKPSSLFREWLPQEQERLPKNWLGMVTGESGKIDNSNVKGDVVYGSPQYRLGKTIGPAEGYKPLDPNAGRFAKYVNGKFGDNEYAEQMVFEAGMNDAGDLTVLTTFDESVFTNPEKARAFIAEFPADQRMAALEIVADENRKNPAFVKSLLDPKTLALIRKSLDSINSDFFSNHFANDPDVLSWLRQWYLDPATNGRDRDTLASLLKHQMKSPPGFLSSMSEDALMLYEKDPDWRLGREAVDFLAQDIRDGHKDSIPRLLELAASPDDTIGKKAFFEMALMARNDPSVRDSALRRFDSASSNDPLKKRIMEDPTGILPEDFQQAEPWISRFVQEIKSCKTEAVCKSMSIVVRRFEDNHAKAQCMVKLLEALDR